MKRPWKWSFLVLMFAALCVLAGNAMPASAATGVDGIPILVAHNYQQAHACSVIGTPADGYEAVVCADILTAPVSGSVYEDWGRTEVICETTSTHITVQCAQVDSYGQLWSGAGEIAPTYSFVCGHQFGPCSSSRDEVSTPAHHSDSSASTCSSNPNTADQQWMVVLSGTAVELPVSGKWVTAGTNRSSGHFYICP